ncbi:hypothetical protein BGZ79_007133 [Entomortierella chlamydospora]|nr:hypothetical protein BGZ79_007133 [Entomortierella chlamydospora]
MAMIFRIQKQSTIRKPPFAQQVFVSSRPSQSQRREALRQSAPTHSSHRHRSPSWNSLTGRPVVSMKSYVYGISRVPLGNRGSTQGFPGLIKFSFLITRPNIKANKVIVIFKKGTEPSVIEAAAKDIESQGGKIGHRYNSALLGFAAEIPDVGINALITNANVDYVEPDGEVSAYAQNLLVQ